VLSHDFSAAGRPRQSEEAFVVGDSVPRVIGASKADEELAVASVGSERAAADGHAGASASVAPAVRERWPFWVPVGILIVGLLVTGTLALVSNSLYVNNEKRLLDLRVREVGSVLAGAQPGVQTPLASAAALANATNGDVPKFRRFITPYVGVSPGHQFVSVSLWRLGSP
jgi:hypothetical protein